MQYAIEKCSYRCGISEELVPIIDRSIRRQQRRVRSGT
jgi:hypothetical protein